LVFPLEYAFNISHCWTNSKYSYWAIECRCITNLSNPRIACTASRYSIFPLFVQWWISAFPNHPWLRIPPFSDSVTERIRVYSQFSLWQISGVNFAPIGKKAVETCAFSHFGRNFAGSSSSFFCGSVIFEKGGFIVKIKEKWEIRFSVFSAAV
jgi:hypothetical protein